jgi:RNA polymerase sigma-70 factor (ECF subfamily)
MASDIEKLMRRLAAGESSALGELYDLFAGRTNALALRILRNTQEAEDVVQEVFLQAWRQAGRFDARRGSVEAWLLTMARTRAVDRLRRRSSRREAPSETAVAATEPPATEEALAVRKALEGLTPDQRQALELAYYDGLTQSEIATRLGQPLGTIKTRIRTAMGRLREVLR